MRVHQRHCLEDVQRDVAMLVRRRYPRVLLSLAALTNASVVFASEKVADVEIARGRVPMLSGPSSLAYRLRDGSVGLSAGPAFAGDFAASRKADFGAAALGHVSVSKFLLEGHGISNFSGYYTVGGGVGYMLPNWYLFAPEVGYRATKYSGGEVVHSPFFGYYSAVLLNPASAGSTAGTIDLTLRLGPTLSSGHTGFFFGFEIGIGLWQAL